MDISLIIIIFSLILLSWNQFFVEGKVVEQINEPNLSSFEYLSLYEFYNATNGNFWTWRELTDLSIPWDFLSPSPNPCFENWQGLDCACNSTACSVAVIELLHHNLSGALPDSIGNFKRLKTLNLSGNNLTSTIPQNITELQELLELDLAGNGLVGAIPSDIGNLQSLKMLDLSYNELNSTIPESLSSCINLEILSLGYNHLEGAIPFSFGNLANLTVLSMIHNLLGDKLPPSIGNLTKLESIDLSQNCIEGSIPGTVGNMINLKTWTTAGSCLTGRIPEGFTELENLESFFIDTSGHFGSIPAGFGLLPKLLQFVVASNFLTGTVPGTFRHAKNLFSFFLEVNSFHGNLSAISNLANISITQLNNNFFTGSISDVFLNDANILQIDVAYNSLSGSLPYSNKWERLVFARYNGNFFTGNITRNYENQTTLTYFLAQYNFLSSSLSEGMFKNCGRLVCLDINSNLFTGSLPANSIGYFRGLNQLYLNSNFFTGSLPPEIGYNYNLVVMSLYANSFSGTIPETVAQMTYLQELFVQDNKFSGAFQNTFNFSVQNRFTSIDISNNRFTGTIPVELFSVCHSLQSLILSSNCLRGSIPSAICNAESLVSLSLDGLATAENCRIYIFPSFTNTFNSFVLDHYIDGSIPDCLFSMPNIELLHLSGNGLVGSLASDLDLSPKLTDLSLSHNLLTGTIPSEIQTKYWDYLDLSYNKLTGTLESNFSSNNVNNSLTLEVNRLSGVIPSGLVEAGNVTILNGNIFSCNIDGSNLPQHDPDVNTYSCGSDNVNNSLYAWLIVLFIIGISAILILFYIRRGKTTIFEQLHSLVNHLYKWKSELRNVSCIPELHEEKSRSSNELQNRKYRKSLNIYRLSIYFQEIRKSLLYLTLYCLIILLPLDSVLKLFYASYAVEYAWTASGMLLSGEVAGILLFLALLCFVVLTQYLFKKIVYKIKNHSELPRDNSLSDRTTFSSVSLSFTALRKTIANITGGSAMISQGQRSSISESFLEVLAVYICVFFLDLMLMGFVDFSYVYIVVTYDTLIITLAVIGLALFRLLANYILLWKAIPGIMMLFLKMNCLSSNRWNTEEWKNAEKENVEENISSPNVSFFGQFRSTFAANVRETTPGSKQKRYVMEMLYYYTSKDISFLENIILFNNIVIPCIAIIFILPDCFYNALFAPANVSSTYEYQECSEYFDKDNEEGHQCGPQSQTTSYTPPYIYSYQCSSKIIINYVPVYVLMFLFVGILFPMFQVVCKWLYDRRELALETATASGSLEVKDTALVSYLYRVIELSLPDKMKSLSSLVPPPTGSSQLNSAANSFSNTTSPSPNLAEAGGDNKDSLSLPPSSSITELEQQFHAYHRLQESRKNNRIVFFSKMRMTIQINSYFAIMISFGALFPPLAFLAFLSIVVVTYLEEISLGKILGEIRSRQYFWLEDQISEECARMEGGINLTIWSTLFVSCSLFAYMVFDIMGDENGWEGALPMALIMLSLPFVLLGGNMCYDSYQKKNRGREGGDDGKKEGEGKLDPDMGGGKVEDTGDDIHVEEGGSENRIFIRSRVSDIQMISRDSTRNSNLPSLNPLHSIDHE